MQNTTTKENETLIAIGTAYVQGEDVAGRGRVLLFSAENNVDNPQNLVLFQNIYSFTLLNLWKLYRYFLLLLLCWFSILWDNYSYFWYQVSEVFSKELKGAISALASLQGHLLIASGPKIILHKWTGSDLTGVAFFDVPPLYVVSLNIVSILPLVNFLFLLFYFQ